MTEPLPVLIRPCFEQDLQNVEFIYAHHVLHGRGTFETVPPDFEETRRRWLHVVGSGWPYLVAASLADPSRIVGFAYAAQFRERAAYAHTFEDSVYVAPGAMRRAVGAQLLAGLIVELADIDARQLAAFIGDSANAASIALHKKHGFEQVGVMRGVGFKFGRWLDVVIMQRGLSRD
ncbi:MAG: N-acetyltransferase family protein [Hyphomonadaceae bacterium]